MAEDALSKARQLAESDNPQVRAFAEKWIASYEETGEMLSFAGEGTAAEVEQTTGEMEVHNDGFTIVAHNEEQVAQARKGLADLLRQKGVDI